VFTWGIAAYGVTNEINFCLTSLLLLCAQTGSSLQLERHLINI
jgi:hypothetical protein